MGATSESKFKAGDRVVAKSKWYGAEIGKIYTVRKVERFDYSGKFWIWLKEIRGNSSDGSLPEENFEAAFSIKEGRTYKSSKGLKVGPMALGDGRFYVRGKLGTWNVDGTASHHYKPTKNLYGSLISEWIDEPTLGDVLSAAIGKSLTVHVKRPSQTAIVALIVDGQPKPSDRPHLHASTSAAEKEAARLASVYKGKEFGVFVLTTTRHEAAPVYGHKWQTLAAMGLKIDAIKELRSITGLGLKASKDAVEHWVSNDEPNSRNAA